MRYPNLVFVLLLVLGACKQKEKTVFDPQRVAVSTIYEDSVSIRAIDFLDQQTLAFAGNNGVYGTYTIPQDKIRSNILTNDSINFEFRAIAHNNQDFFMISVANPALLYKTGDGGKMELVYTEQGEAVFYDAMAFWNTNEGLAIGDSNQGCFSILITRDAGNSWKRLPCEALPPFIEGEGAYAASNSNIKIIGDTTWIATTKRFLKSMDKGKTWVAQETPISGSTPYHGMYSMDFYDENVGFAIGGDFSEPNGNYANKALTIDGGKTWNLVADGEIPGYQSCVQFLPNGKGDKLVSVGFTGIHYSADQGQSWKKLSEEGFYTIRFLNDSIAFAAGKNRIAKLVFKE